MAAYACKQVDLPFHAKLIQYISQYARSGALIFRRETQRSAGREETMGWGGGGEGEGKERSFSLGPTAPAYLALIVLRKRAPDPSLAISLSRVPRRLDSGEKLARETEPVCFCWRWQFFFYRLQASPFLRFFLNERPERK